MIPWSFCPGDHLSSVCILFDHNGIKLEIIKERSLEISQTHGNEKPHYWMLKG